MAKTGVSLAHARELEGRKEQPDPAPQSRDFFWDSITLYIVGVILALTAIDVVSEFIRGADVQCYQPNETQSDILSSVQNYVNEFCRGHVPTLQFLPSFIAIHAIAILLPHYAWLNAYGADLDFFFRHVSKLERNRKEDTGDYPAINYTISKEMEEAFSKYGKPNGMYWSYIAKILFQIVLCILGIILVPLVFFKYSEQNVAFQCPESESDAKGDSWPLPYRETVTCVFSPMNLLQRIWLVYLFLLAVAALFMLINLIQLAKWHTNELGLKNCAKFSFQTGLSYHYCHPSVKKVFKRNIAKRDSSSLLYPFSPYSIESNYDFLIVKLFRTEGGLAYIMKEVHVLRLLREMNKTDLTIVNLYRLGDTGSDVKGKEFVRADTGWTLPEFASCDHVPALDEKVLVLPQEFRGAVMGCALRCEGSYDQEIEGEKLKRFAKERLKVADCQLALAQEMLELQRVQEGSEENKQETEADGNQTKAKQYIFGTKSDASRVSDLNRKQAELVKCKQDLEVATSTIERALELESNMESLREKFMLGAVSVRLGREKRTNIEQESDVKKSETGSAVDRGTDEDHDSGEEVKEKGETASASGVCPVGVKHGELQQTSVGQYGGQDGWKEVKEKGKTSGAVVQASSPMQRHLQSHIKLSHELDEVTATASELQLRVLQLEPEIRADKFNRDKKRKQLVQDLMQLKLDQQKLLYKQQQLARERGFTGQQVIALQLSGPALQSALIIGFDMESLGIPSALARVFRRVGFINFSSHYADYQNPVKVLNRSYYIFNVTIPSDILTRDDLVGGEGAQKSSSKLSEKEHFGGATPTDCAECMSGGSPPLPRMLFQVKQVVKELNEIWYRDFRNSGVSGNTKFSNFVVVGPLSDHMHIVTVNRLLSECKDRLSGYVVLLTILPKEVSETKVDFKEYSPPPSYEEISRHKTKLEGTVQSWKDAVTSAGTDGDPSPFHQVNIGDATLEFSFKLYRQKHTS